MTLPPSEVRETVTTREFVTSQIHQARWFATWRPTGGPFSIRAEAAPFAIGRLAVQLPDKYPGRTLVFRSRTSLIGVGAALTHSIGAMELELSARADRSFSYSRKAAMDLNSLSFLLGIGTR
jgi:hypothetical protein